MDEPCWNQSSADRRYSANGRGGGAPHRRLGLVPTIMRVMATATDDA